MNEAPPTRAKSGVMFTPSAASTTMARRPAQPVGDQPAKAPKLGEVRDRRSVRHDPPHQPRDHQSPRNEATTTPTSIATCPPPSSEIVRPRPARAASSSRCYGLLDEDRAPVVRYPAIFAASPLFALPGVEDRRILVEERPPLLGHFGQPVARRLLHRLRLGLVDPICSSTTRAVLARTIASHPPASRSLLGRQRYQAQRQDVGVDPRSASASSATIRSRRRAGRRRLLAGAASGICADAGLRAAKVRSTPTATHRQRRPPSASPVGVMVGLPCRRGVVYTTGWPTRPPPPALAPRVAAGHARDLCAGPMPQRHSLTAPRAQDRRQEIKCRDLGRTACPSSPRPPGRWPALRSRPRRRRLRPRRRPRAGGALHHPPALPGGPLHRGQRLLHRSRPERRGRRAPAAPADLRRRAAARQHRRRLRGPLEHQRRLQGGPQRPALLRPDLRRAVVGRHPLRAPAPSRRFRRRCRPRSTTAAWPT